MVFCCIGAVLPDIIDKAILREFFHSDFRLFLWHRDKIINLFYNFYFEYLPNIDLIFFLSNVWIVVFMIISLIVYRKYYF